MKKRNNEHANLNLIKNYRWRSIFFHYWKILAIAFLIPVIILNIIVSIYYSSKVNNEMQNSVNASFTQTCASTDNLFANFNKYFSMFYVNDFVNNFLTSPTERVSGKDMTYNRIMISELMSNYISISGCIDSISIYSPLNSYVISSNQSYFTEQGQDRKWYDHYTTTGEDQFILSDTSFAGTPIISMAFQFISRDAANGLCVIDINNQQLEKLLNDSSLPGMNMFLVKSDNTIIHSTDPNFIGQTFDEQQFKTHDSIMLSEELNNVPMTLYIYYSTSDFTNTNRSAIATTVLVAFITLILTIALSLWCAMYFYRSIAEIILMIEMPSDIKTTSKTDNSYNELLYISDHLLSMMSKSAHIENEMIAKIQNLKQAQLIALQTQINPHFLFNTLNLINVIIMRITKSDNDATRVVSLLSDLLHVSLDTQQYIVPVETELDTLKKYIEIEQLKTHNLFDVEYDIDENILKCRTIKLILQPIVENSISHGIKKLRTRRGLIRISIKGTNGNIVFKISDNGPGITPEQLDIIDRQLKENILPESRHIGISNVHQRIRLIYGEKYGISISSSENGTETTLTIPKESNGVSR